MKLQNYLLQLLLRAFKLVPPLGGNLPYDFLKDFFMISTLFIPIGILIETKDVHIVSKGDSLRSYSEVFVECSSGGKQGWKIAVSQ